VLAPGDVHLAREVLWLERSDGVEDALPSFFPPSHYIGASGTRSNLEFPIAVTIWLFTIGGQEIGPAGTHVSCHVLYQHGYAVGFGVD